MKSVSLIAIAAAALSSPAAAQDRNDEREQAVEQSSAAADEDSEYLDKVVCHTERVTGSLTRVNRTCMTRREWNLSAERTRNEMDKIVRDRDITMTPIESSHVNILENQGG